jgi:hypothetical protein
MKLYTDTASFPAIEQDLSKRCDILKIQTFLSNVVCGVQDGQRARASCAATEDLRGEAHQSRGVDRILPSWMKSEGDAAQIDPAEADEQFHSEPNNILQEGERVEMAFKGKKDFMLFTTKRIMFVDNKKVGIIGMRATKVEYFTVPYFAIGYFSIVTPGGGILLWKDTDCELLIGTKSTNWSDYEPPVEGRLVEL